MSWKKVLVASTIFIIGCGSNIEEELINNLIIETEEFSIIRKDFDLTVKLTGITEADKNSELSSQVDGRIEKLFVDTGDTVKRDDLVAKFSEDESTAETNYKNSQNNLETAKQTAQSSVSKAKIEINNNENELEQTIKTQEKNYNEIFQNLITSSKNSETNLMLSFDWVDRIVLATNRFRYNQESKYYHIGRNQSVKKQELKNELNEILLEIKETELEKSPLPIFDETIKSEKIILDYAKIRLYFAKKLQNIVREVDALIRRSSYNQSFTSDEREELERSSAQKMSNIDSSTLELEKTYKSAETIRESQKQIILEAQNLLELSKYNYNIVESNAESAVTIAQNNLDLAQIQKNEIKLFSPFAGIITKKFLDEGVLVKSGTPIFELADISKFKIIVEIPDEWVGEISVGDVAEIIITGFNEKVFTGVVNKIEPLVDSNSRTVRTEIVINENDSNIKIGMLAKINLKISEKMGFFIDKKFLKLGFDGYFIKLKNGEKISVKTGIEENNQWQIISPILEEGLIIIR